MLRDYRPSKVHELGLFSQRDQVGFLRGFMNLQSSLREAWTYDPFSSSRQTYQFIKAMNLGESSQKFDETVGRTAIRVTLKPDRPTTQVSTCPFEVIGNQRQLDQNRGSFLFGDLRLSNVLLEQSSEPELSPDEKRYKELNQRHYGATLDEEDQRELARLEKSLDEADAKDPHLTTLQQNLSKGYDKLDNGLRQINAILDELLKE